MLFKFSRNFKGTTLKRGKNEGRGVWDNVDSHFHWRGWIYISNECYLRHVSNWYRRRRQVYAKSNGVRLRCRPRTAYQTILRCVFPAGYIPPISCVNDATTVPVYRNMCVRFGVWIGVGSSLSRAEEHENKLGLWRVI